MVRQHNLFKKQLQLREHVQAISFNYYRVEIKLFLSSIHDSIHSFIHLFIHSFIQTHRWKNVHIATDTERTKQLRVSVVKDPDKREIAGPVLGLLYTSFDTVFWGK